MPHIIGHQGTSIRNKPSSNVSLVKENVEDIKPILPSEVTKRFNALAPIEIPEVRRPSSSNIAISKQKAITTPFAFNTPAPTVSTTPTLKAIEPGNFFAGITPDLEALRQFESTTGRSITPKAIEGIVKPQLEVASDRALQAEQLKQQQDIAVSQEALQRETLDVNTKIQNRAQQLQAGGLALDQATVQAEIDIKTADLNLRKDATIADIDLKIGNQAINKAEAETNRETAKLKGELNAQELFMLDFANADGDPVILADIQSNGEKLINYVNFATQQFLKGDIDEDQYNATINESKSRWTVIKAEAGAQDGFKWENKEDEMLNTLAPMNNTELLTTWYGNYDKRDLPDIADTRGDTISTNPTSEPISTITAATAGERTPQGSNALGVTDKKLKDALNLTDQNYSPTRDNFRLSAIKIILGHEVKHGDGGRDQVSKIIFSDRNGVFKIPGSTEIDKPINQNPFSTLIEQGGKEAGFGDFPLSDLIVLRKTYVTRYGSDEAKRALGII